VIGPADAVGRGAGVGRGRGVGVGLGVAVGFAAGNWNVPMRVNQLALLVTG
jgi:hypothetical protein